MRLYKKIFIIFCLVFSLLTLVLYSASRYILLHSFRSLENAYVLQNVQRLNSAITDQITQLNTIATDWAEWDDTYSFAHGAQPEYVRVNLIDSTFVILKLNLILLVSERGEIIHSKSYDLAANKTAPFPEGLRDHLKPGGLLLSCGSNGFSGGIVLLPGGPMLVAAHPILTSAKQGPPAGVFIMARSLDTSTVKGISQLIHSPVTVLPLKPEVFAREGKETYSRVLKDPSGYIRPQSRDRISGYLLLRDIYRKPVLAVRTDMDRGIYRHGLQSFFQLFVWLVFIGLVFYGLFLFVLDRWILSRISRLMRNVRSIWAQDDNSRRLMIEGNDEITAFAMEINRMIHSLQSAKEKLRTGEERLRAQYRGIPLPTGTWRRVGDDFEFIDYNDAAFEMTGGKIAQVIGKNASVLFRERPELAEAFERCWKEKSKETIEIRDKPFFLENERFLRYSLNHIPPDLIILHLEDISERKKAEGKLLSMQRKLRSLASELSTTEERERRRVAMHLHDHIGHGLALCQFRLEALQENVPAEINSELEEIRKTVVSAINETRSLTIQLCPPVLYELGLAPALDWLGEQTMRKHGLTVKVREKGEPEKIDTDLRAMLFQSAQELVFNVVKHAEAKSIGITVCSENSHVQVMVEDDGRGFDVSDIDSSADESGGFGLFNIRERLEYIGGSMNIHSDVGAGTLVTLKAPLHKKKGAKHDSIRE